MLTSCTDIPLLFLSLSLKWACVAYLWLPLQHFFGEAGGSLCFFRPALSQTLTSKVPKNGRSAVNGGESGEGVYGQVYLWVPAVEWAMTQEKTEQ